MMFKGHASGYDPIGTQGQEKQRGGGGEVRLLGPKGGDISQQLIMSEQADFHGERGRRSNCATA